ncbi:MAG: hypothetical protein KJZ85_18055 [Rhodobacteraceae bacterium]|jgi:hypothetical protein|nr:hypothetical protein [Paracoccaceae bacterium]
MAGTAGPLIANVAPLSGGAAALLAMLRRRALRLLPPAPVGPRGILIDTTRGRLGILQMRGTSPPSSGGSGGGGGC